MADLSFDTHALEEQAKLAEGTRKEVKRGLWLAGAFFVGLLGWAAATPLDAGAVAQGTVAVAGNRQLMQHREGGILTALEVREGQEVKKGQLLAQVSQSNLIADERSLASEQISLLAARERLKAELNGAGSFAEPVEFRHLTGEDRELANQAMATQVTLLAAKRSSLASQRAVLHEREGQSQAMIAASEHQMTANLKQQTLINEELTGLRELEGRGFVAKNRLRETERNAAQLEGNYGSLQSNIAQSQQSIGEARMQSASLQRQQVESAAEELHTVEVRLFEIMPKLAAAREQVERAAIRAPADGKVVNLRVHTLGGVIQPGETLMEVIPTNRELVIQTRTPPSDIDGLRPGMQAQVRFSSLHDREIPTLYGQVRTVSADSIEDERTGARFFSLEVVVPQSELAKVEKVHGGQGVKAGIPAEVVLPLRKRSALAYLFEPIANMFWLSGHER